MGLELTALLADPVMVGEGVVHGDGQPVMLLPGFLLDDDSLGLMTGWLLAAGYRTIGAGPYPNVDCSEASVARLTDRLERFAQREGRRVAIVGQSRGGLYARVLAVRRPDLVSGIVTLGSPVMAPAAVHPLMVMQASWLAWFRIQGAPGLLSWECAAGECCASFWTDLVAPFRTGIGYESIYSRSDGIVDWRACLDPGAAHREIDSSHYGMAVNAHAYREVAGALARFRSP